VNRIILWLGTATLMAISIASAPAKDKPSEAFLKKAIEGNFAEVSMGDLAQKNGQSDGVKSYGKMLSTDHAAANQKALDAAKDLVMNPPTGPNAKQKADYDKMSKMSGVGFDKMFATHMVADHQKDIADTRRRPRSRMLPENMLQARSIRCRNIWTPQNR
jgi:putative membrane protein